MRVVLDIESNDFLSRGIDYSRMPYRLKPDYKVWCVVCRDVDTQDVYKFVGDIKNVSIKYPNKETKTLTVEVFRDNLGRPTCSKNIEEKQFCPATCVAIGPHYDERFEEITDNLPLL